MKADCSSTKVVMRTWEYQVNLPAVLSWLFSSVALVISIAAFRRTSRQSLEEERDRLLALLNEDRTWAMVSEAKLQGVRFSIVRFPTQLREELRAEVDRLEKQTTEVAERSKAMAEGIRLNGALSETELRGYRRSIEEMKPVTLAVAEQHNQIIASFPLWGEPPRVTAGSKAESEGDGGLGNI
jgi:hypothetical protein